jgi:hypothetical protein
MYAFRLALRQLLYKGGGNRLFPHLYKLVRVLLGFYAITRNSTVDTSTVKNSIALQGQPCATLLNGCYLRERLA